MPGDPFDQIPPDVVHALRDGSMARMMEPLTEVLRGMWSEVADELGMTALELREIVLSWTQLRRVTSLAYARWPWPFPPPMEFAWYPDPSSFRLDARR